MRQYGTLSETAYSGRIPMSEPNHQINESADKIRLKAEVKRGESTRDQDKVNLTIKGSDPEETANRLKATLDALEANGVAQQLRDTQPEAEE